MDSESGTKFHKNYILNRNKFELRIYNRYVSILQSADTLNGEIKLKIIHLTVIIRKENPMYVSWCPELDISSQGKTIEKAIHNVKEAIELYLEDEDAYVPPELYEEPCAESPILTCLNVEA